MRAATFILAMSVASGAAVPGPSMAEQQTPARSSPTTPDAQATARTITASGKVVVARAAADAAAADVKPAASPGADPAATLAKSVEPDTGATPGEVRDTPATQSGAALLDPAPAGGTSQPDPLTPPEVVQPPQLAPGAADLATAPHQTSVADPVLVLVRQKLAGVSASGGLPTAADEAGLVQFYAGASRPLWAGPRGFNDKARQALAALANADDWGLDPARLDSPGSTPASANADTDALATFEIALSRAVLTYARHARGGRIDPLSLSRMYDRKPRLFEPTSVLAGLAGAADAGVYLQGLHPRHRQFELLRGALVALKAPDASAPPQLRIPDGPSLEPGRQHPHVALLRQRLGQQTTGDNAEIYDEALKVVVEAYQREHGLTIDGIVGAGTREALNGLARGSSTDTRRLIVANLERWRWMPEDLGKLHVWNNIPEQISRVLDGGEVVFKEKIVVGKPGTPTVNFSAGMKYVIFHPTWGVPDGIKTNEIAPMLRRTSNNADWWFGGNGRTASSVLNRLGGLQVSIGGRPVNPDAVDWSRIDVRGVQFTQPAGSRNVLGIVKFRFPNKHDIYMHDTPERHLFANGKRAFSHGCMRVENPVRLAEVLLARDKGMSPQAVRAYVQRSGTQQITLSTTIPVHVVYFTAVADADGKLRTFGDLYGVDSRVASALEGRSVRVARAADPTSASQSSARAPRKERRRSSGRQQAAAPASQDRGNNPFANVFGN